MCIVRFNFKRCSLLLGFVFSLNLISGQSLSEVVYAEGSKSLIDYVDEYGFDHCENGYNLITSIAASGNLSLLKEAISLGADINEYCEGGYSAFYIAALYNRVEVGQFLLQNKVDLGFRDGYGKTAMDVAFLYNNIDFLQKVYRMKMDHFADTDGPYLFDNGDRLEMLRFVREESGVRIDSVSISKQNIYNVPFECVDADGNKLFEFKLRKSPLYYRSVYGMPKQMLALSDIEGKYEAFVNILYEAGVIDKSLNWTFGKGHLVLAGDFFDRGEMVTETLWLIYKLEQEAHEAGGVLHFLLGNHEMMNLRGDWRYVPKKYLINAQLAGKSYHEFYDPNTILGKWLRSKNSLVRIGGYLFCHAGLSPDFLIAQMPISLINETIRELIDTPDEDVPNVFNGEFLLRDFGPLWYRGHFEKLHTQEELEKILSTFDARYLVVGHTPVEEIQTLYDGRIIALDVPHAKGRKYQAALMLERNRKTVIRVDGSRYPLN